MLERYKTVYRGKEGEIIEKKSRFIATVRLVETEEEALAFIEEMKKKYWNATHNCFAYVIGERRECVRCSDDGEPQGTAGRPMLDVLLGEEVHNVAVVVTRYFGGTLLGTGGLVRAYSRSAALAVEAAGPVVMRRCAEMTLVCDYAQYGWAVPLLREQGGAVGEPVFAEQVTVPFHVPEEKTAGLLAALTERSAGQLTAVETGRAFFSFEGE